MRTKEAQARASKKWKDKKLAEKLAAMNPEEREKYEKNRARLLPFLEKARQARVAKGPEWATAVSRRAAFSRFAQPAADISQDKPIENNMPNPETIPDTAPAIPAPGELLTIAQEMPVKINVRGYTQWDAEERQKLCVAVALKLRAQGLRHAPQEHDREGNRFLMDAVQAAQYETFEKARRRHIAGRSALGKKFFRDLEIALTAKTDAETLVKKLEAEQKPAAAQVPATPAASAAPAMTDEQIVTAGLAGATLAQLAQAAMGRIFETLGQYEAKMNGLADFDNALVDELDLIKRQLGQMQVELTNLRGTAKIKLPIVAIVGCMPHLYHHIIDGAKSTGINCDFRHYEQGSKARPFTADYAIVLHWVGHDWDDQVHNAVPDRTRAKFIGTGGVGMAIKQLKEWFPHE